MSREESPIEVNGFNFEHEVLKANLPVLVDVTASWCPPCRAAEPVLNRLARERAGQLKVVRVDGGACPELVAALRVRGFPTFVLFEAGRETRRQAGFSGSRSLFALLDP